MIQTDHNVFILHTNRTTYAFRVLETGHLEHLYYGRKITVEEPLTKQAIAALTEKHTFMPGNCNAYDQEHTNFTLEDMRLEMSSYGKGDIREPFVEIIHADGSYTSDFLYETSEVSKGKAEYETLPGSYDESGKVEHLCVTLRDVQYDLIMELHYYVYADCDVITRSTRLVNTSAETVRPGL
jgi:alpha-galactosidase